MILSQMVQDAIARLKQYNLGLYNSASNKFGLSGVGGMAANWSRHSKDIATTCEAVASIADTVVASTADAAGSATAAAGSAVAADASRSATQTLLTQGQTTVQGLVTQAQTARDGAAADRALAQNYIGTATNVIVPAINYRLASAWDATGQPTAYTLAGVVAVHRYDTRLDWERGAWRRGKIARASSWYNETLNTATRGSKREFPVVALIVATASMVVIYDAHDLDGSGSPRMWMVFNRGGTYPSNDNMTGVTAQTNGPVHATSGRLYVTTPGATWGLLEVDFAGDRGTLYAASATYRYRSGIGDRNAGRSIGQISAQALGSGNTVHVHARVLPGAHLDPVSRLPVPTVAVVTANGVSVIHPTGLVASISGTATGYSRVVLHADGWIMLQDAAGATVRAGRLPFSNVTETAWQVKRYWPTTPPALLNSNVQALCPIATGHAAGLVLLAEDRANQDNGMVAHITRDYATGWMAGDCRLAALCDGAGSAGASGGELIQTPDFGSAAGWTTSAGWSISGGFANFSNATGSGVSTPVNVTAGTDYTATLVVTSISGLLQVSLQGGSQVLGPLISAPGTYQIPLRAVAGNNQILIYAANGATVAVDSLSLRKAGIFSDAAIQHTPVNDDLSAVGSWTLSAVTPNAGAGTFDWSASGGYADLAMSGLQTGQQYAVTFTLSAWTSGTLECRCPSNVPDATAQVASAGTFTKYFTASASAMTLRFIAASTLTASLTSVRVDILVADRSYKGKGFRLNGTLNRAAVGTGNDVVAYSGFGPNKYLSQPYNPDYDPSTGDLCIAMWHRAATGSGWLAYRADAAGGALYRVGHNVSGVSFFVSDGTISQALNTTTGWSDSSWHLGLFIRRAATGRLEFWLDGVLAASADASTIGSLSKNTAIMTIGAAVDGSTPATSAELALVRVGTYAPTPAQIRRLYADESALFQPGAKAFLGGTSSSVQALAQDEEAGALVVVATADGADRFAGLRRVAHLAPAAGTAFTAASVTSVSAGGGAVLIGTASEAGVVTELQPIKDELRQGLPAPANEIVMEGVTTDATPADIGKVFVNEGESVQIEMEVQASEYGQTPTEGASYTVRARVRRNLNGSVQLVGSAYHVTVDETTSTMDATVAVDTAAQAFAVNVTGKAGVRLIWRARLRLNWISEVRHAA